VCTHTAVLSFFFSFFLFLQRPFYWSFQELKAYVQQHGVDGKVNGHNDKDLWHAIQTLIVKTILSAEYKLANHAKKNVQHEGNCFELLGVDVLVDHHLKPWLVEVNPDPDMSAHAGFALAYETKGKMLNDLTSLLSIDQNDASVAKLGTKEYEKERQGLASLLLQAGKGPGGAQEHGPRHQYLSVFEKNKCNLKAAVLACGVQTRRDALLIAGSEIEFNRKKKWQRLVPSTTTSKKTDKDYLNWFYEKKKTDLLLNCWENQVFECSQRDRARK
jgi:hypothetical protein|tara:strand:+ start:579 stop:1397 length:819 start_codon:yes stop_codon:yes gene_type:complete